MSLVTLVTQLSRTAPATGARLHALAYFTYAISPSYLFITFALPYARAVRSVQTFGTLCGQPFIQIYMDMELRNGDVEPSKRLFERATSLKLSSKKMKFFFTRYLTFAREQGDAELIAHVKEKARAFVESAAAGE